MHYANHEVKASVPLSPAPSTSCCLNGTKTQLCKVSPVWGERDTLQGVGIEVPLKDHAAGA